MKINTEYAIAIPRIGLSLIFLWFGYEQLIHTDAWISYIPEAVVKYSPVDASTIIHFNGAFELVFSLALLFGIFTRITSLLLGLHLAHITATVGFNSIGVRDFGIVMGVLGVFFYGPDKLSLDTIFSTQEELDLKSIPPKTPSTQYSSVVNSTRLPL